MTSGRKPKLTFSEQIKLRTIQNAYGIASPKVDAFWKKIREGRAALYDRKRKWGMSSEERKKRQRECSKRYDEKHRDDPKRKETHRKASLAYYYRKKKSDPNFLKHKNEIRKKWIERTRKNAND